jgi:hypothetical protein
MKFSVFAFAAAVVALVLPGQTAAQAGAVASPLSLNQTFVCNTGYTQQECHVQMTVLREALSKFPSAQPGPWTWVVVRSRDWKSILLDRHMDSNIPAFSYLPARETFVEEALLLPQSVRGFELSQSWGMSIPDLLSFAIAHELGHALCNDTSEAGANRTAEMLRGGRSVSCRRLP